jgi:hypothetical protein
MKLKATITAAVASLALSGLLAGGAMAQTPSAQDIAAHPGQIYITECQQTEEQSLPPTWSMPTRSTASRPASTPAPSGGTGTTNRTDSHPRLATRRG